ncbi:VWA domain-containing protein [Nostoc sp. NMS8]|uniref:vWA domain-containing protein n=1 Tax=Nostoc sp. NMS8 TaxID=2815392 RepID=UPI0025F24146|nr:VWA domain-containing protein [Nostoc sp. NMS8]MBN3963341.1 VWA domain-containing protein [Nostoc sp. NMS8]
MPVGQPEFVFNPEPRCPVILLLDTSGSMDGQPLQELNRGLVAFKQSVQEDGLASLRVEVAIVTFGGSVRLVQDFVTIDQFVPPQLEATGVTPMGEAIAYGLDWLEERKETYKDNGIQYYRPWIWLITDGAPTDSWQNAAQRVKDAERNRKISFFAVGVQNADMVTLSQITPDERPALRLNGLDFKSMFLWLSQSMKQVSNSKPGGTMVALPSLGWGQVSS